MDPPSAARVILPERVRLTGWLLKILTFTTLYPNQCQPRHGVFVEQRLRKLLEAGNVEAQVVAPVPFFPVRSGVFGRYATYARVPARESRFGVQISHPRYVVIPKVGMSLAPLLMYASVRHPTARLVRAQEVDLIDAHYLYPDGVTAALISRMTGKPLVLTARGTDVNWIPRYSIPRRWVLWALSQASAIVTVCQALKDTLIEMGVSDRRVTVLRNGVDLELFRPEDKRAAREALGLRDRSTIISVGHLITRKGHDLVIQALKHLPGLDLAIVGGGEEEARLKGLVAEIGLSDRVFFYGERSHSDLRYFYSAADALVLASSREGWPNVLLEAMACGTPVVATSIWGTPEVVRSRDAGLLVDRREPSAIACAMHQLLAERPRREDTRRYAEQFSWDQTTTGQEALFRKILRRQDHEDSLPP